MFWNIWIQACFIQDFNYYLTRSDRYYPGFVDTDICTREKRMKHYPKRGMSRQKSVHMTAMNHISGNTGQRRLTSHVIRYEKYNHGYIF